MYWSPKMTQELHTKKGVKDVKNENNGTLADACNMLKRVPTCLATVNDYFRHSYRVFNRDIDFKMEIIV